MVVNGRLPLLKWLAKGAIAELCSYRPVCRFVCWRFARQTGKVALTFDDGPSPTYTREVLDVLDREKVRATFFVLGESIEENPGYSRTSSMRGTRSGSTGTTTRSSIWADRPGAPSASCRALA